MNTFATPDGSGRSITIESAAAGVEQPGTAAFYPTLIDDGNRR